VTPVTSFRVEANRMTAVQYRSIPDMFLKRVTQDPDKQALGRPAPGDAGAPVWITWRQVGERAKAIAAGLHDLGIRNEDRVAILSSTRLEWVLADLGIVCAGAATTTVYPTTESEDATYIVRDSGSKVLIAENAEQAAKVTGLDLAAVVVIDGPATDGRLTLDDLEERGKAVLGERPALIDEIVETIKPEHLATLIYTSGTTGRPKGVELLHAGWVWEGWAQADSGIMHSDDLQYLWLPLSHSFGKTLVTGIVYVGVQTYVDGRIDKLVDNLAVVQPTLMAAPPRVFEKVYNRAVATAQDAGGLKWRIFSWALDVGKRSLPDLLAGHQPGGLLGLQYTIAERLVFNKIRARLGGRIRAMISGSAPLSREIAEFFHGAGLKVLEGYGLTESSAGNFVNRTDKAKLGTVGRPLGDLECRIADDGEILLRGVPVMRGYHNMPAETAEALSKDGWLHTGDIGELDSEGFLRITDRKKDLIKTSGGKYIAPSYIEGMFKAICPYTSQAIVIGQARNFCSMLITLDPDGITAWAAGGPLDGKSYQEIVTSAQANEMVSAYVKELNAKLNRWETIKKFQILPRDLTIEDGELTPSMKVKRKAVETAYADDIEKMYAGTVAAAS
jgi:long-chain acyl-CoA synthetase